MSFIAFITVRASFAIVILTTYDDYLLVC